MKLNCDLGEGFGTWSKGLDHEIMPLIDLANLACGFHAADPLTMKKTVQLATKHHVTIGAHPSYPDLVGFGRRTMSCSCEELMAIIQYQIGALQAICASEGGKVAYVKPHGALYNDMMVDFNIFETICQAISQLSMALPLIIQAIPKVNELLCPFTKIADNYGITLWFEAFADRQYQDNGLLVPRGQNNAVIEDVEQVIARSQKLLNEQQITSINGLVLPVKVDTLCVHGDNPAAVILVQKLRLLLDQQSINK